MFPPEGLGMDEKVWRVREVADKLDVTIETVLKRLHEGSLKGFRVGRAWRITDEALQEFIRRPAGVRPLSGIDQAMADEGTCTQFAEKDQHQRDTQGREWVPPQPPE